MRVNKWIFGGIILLIVLALTQSISCAESFLDSLALGLEKDIGRSNYESIMMQKRVIQLPSSQSEHLDNLFQRLVSNSNRNKELKFKLTVIQDNTINAFALPAGYVFVNTGLLEYVRNNDELAGILGHEIAHIDRKHGMKAIYRTVGFSFMIGLILNHNQNQKNNEEMAKIAAVSLSLAQLGYSRDAEYEADRYGVDFMQRAGYKKERLLDFWRRFQQQNGESPAPLMILSTHPPTGDRIKRIETLPGS